MNYKMIYISLFKSIKTIRNVFSKQRPQMFQNYTNKNVLLINLQFSQKPEPERMIQRTDGIRPRSKRNSSAKRRCLRARTAPATRPRLTARPSRRPLRPRPVPGHRWRYDSGPRPAARHQEPAHQGAAGRRSARWCPARWSPARSGAAAGTAAPGTAAAPSGPVDRPVWPVTKAPYLTSGGTSRPFRLRGPTCRISPSCPYSVWRIQTFGSQ